MAEERAFTDGSDPALPAALARYGIAVTPPAVALLEGYCVRLWDWNQKLNLTRHTDYDRFVARDVLDCWHLAQHIEPGVEVLDVGSGGGVPGIVLGILRPDLQIVLSESVGKKARVLQSIVGDLELPIPVHDCRAEKLLEDFRFDVLVARAVGPLSKMLGWFRSDWDSIGRLLAVKGPRWVEERAEARHRGLLTQLDLRCVARYPMPGTDSESVILSITRA